MSSLDQLFAEYGYLSHDELTQSQIKILQTRLKETDESVVTSTTDAQHFLVLLRKFREYIADADSWGVFDADRWNAFFDYLWDNKLIEKEIADNHGFTNDYLPK